jgi:C-terminal peptidase prc
MPPEILSAATPTLYPTPTLPANHTVTAEVIDQQLEVLHELADLVDQYYVYRDFNGRDWPALVKQYEALVRGGLEQEDFYFAMDMLVFSLGDEHSFFESPEQIKQSEERMSGKEDFVGLGMYADMYTVAGQGVVLSVLPGSPAEEAGLLPHDILLAVDGGPVLDENGMSRTLGLEGTPVTITIQTPGQAPRDLTLVRRRITSQPRVDACLVPGTRVGYIRWHNFEDTTVVAQTVAALKALNAGGPLEGLILDNRTNGGGSLAVMQDLLALFTQGKMGDVVSGEERTPLTITGQDVQGSQSVPLVVLIGPDTASAGEWSSGLLQLTRGATLIGQRTSGNVEELWGLDLQDGSRLWLAAGTLQPEGLENSAWEGAGLVPDVEVPERWDLFSESTDPAVAKAVEVLGGK